MLATTRAPAAGAADQADAIFGDTRVSAPQTGPGGTLPGGAPLRLLRRIGVVDPGSLDDYRAHGGYAALRRAIDMGPTRVITELEDSSLTGRGGAAFPTGVKWKGVAGAPERPHYLVCNADESEPGTFKDRVLMEGDPFALIESMTIAGYVTGAHVGYLYIRGEYPLATRRLIVAIDAARPRGYLGEDVMGEGFAFDIELRRGAGAYICGEETALLESIEGFRGEPRNKPPFPSVSGLFGKPTAINNVETLYNVLEVLSIGGQSFAEVGGGRSTGSKLFCLSGAVGAPGVYEVDFGTTLRQLLDLAGGVRGDLRTILLGGAAGGFVMPEDLDVVLTLEGARDIGATLGPRRPRLRRPCRPHRHAAAHRGVLPRRVVRAMRALPRRHRAPGGGPGPPGARRADRLAGDRDGAARGPGPCHARRLDLRPRPDRPRRSRRRCSSGCSTGLRTAPRTGRCPQHDHHGQGACRPRRAQRAGRRDDRRRGRGRRRRGDRHGPRGGAPPPGERTDGDAHRRRRWAPPSSTPPHRRAPPRSASPAAP